MLLPASVEDLRKRRLLRSQGYIVIAMRHYPRGIKKEWSDLYSSLIAPSPELFKDFRTAKEKLGDHDRAFIEVDYQNRFSLSEEGKALLKELSERSKTQDVYLVCQCSLNTDCHRDLLMLIAQKQFGARVRLRREYPDFEARLRNENF